MASLPTPAQRHPERRRFPGGSGEHRAAAALGAALLIGGVTLWGCNGYVHRASAAYGEGRYLEVAEDLARHEKEIDRLSAPQRAQYGLYRGLSLLQLGDFEGSRLWLEYAYEIEQSAAGALAPAQRIQLDKAWRLLDELDGTGPNGRRPEPPPRRSPPAGDGPAPPWPDDENGFAPSN